jgi:L-ribulose-5-phosphate 3-epimerase
MGMDRRRFVAGSTLTVLAAPAAVATGVLAPARSFAAEPSGASLAAPASGNRRTLPIAVSTYSFWRFLDDSKYSIEACVDMAAEMGFDAVELLEMQMDRKDNAALQAIKRRCLLHGMSLCGLSTHQSFLFPDRAKRDENVKKTIGSIELAYRLGIPTMRINTGRWGTSKDFDTLMKNRGIEPPLPGYRDDDAYPWVIECIRRCLPTAEKCGVVLGLENHWGLGRTPEGVLRIVEAVNSPWLGITLDTGNFLAEPYDRLEKLAPKTTFVQAKTYYGGGIWYALDLDYPRIAALLKRHGYRGFISLEFEGRENPKTAIPKSLAVLRKAFML